MIVNVKIGTLSKLAIIAVVLLIASLSWSQGISDMANLQIDAGLKRSLVSFAAARTFNSVVSVLQGTELVFEPLGVGLVFSIGQVLGPINDLVQQFSHVMLIASVAFGIQKLLLTIGSTWIVSSLVTGIALTWGMLFWMNRAPALLSRALLVILFIRFVMPVATIGSAYIFDRFSATEYELSLNSLNHASEDLKVLSKEAVSGGPTVKADGPVGSTVAAPVVATGSRPPTVPEKKDFLSRIAGDAKDGLSSVANAVTTIKEKASNALNASAETLRAKYEGIKLTAEKTAERMVNLIVIFLMQTIVIPLILLFVLYRLLNGLIPLGSKMAPI